MLSAAAWLLAWASPCLSGIEWSNETASGKGLQGPFRSAGASVFDQGNTLISQRNFEPWLWEKCPRGRNHESFLAALADEQAISRVEMLRQSAFLWTATEEEACGRSCAQIAHMPFRKGLSNAQQDFAHSLVPDHPASSRPTAGLMIIPEPGTAAFLILGTGGLILLKSRRKAAA
jgi:hypothetical protein